MWYALLGVALALALLMVWLGKITDREYRAREHFIRVTDRESGGSFYLLYRALCASAEETGNDHEVSLDRVIHHIRRLRDDAQ